jgi:MATE family multidrug resistance protein
MTAPSLQRDYGLIRNQIASSNQNKVLSPELVAEDEEEDVAESGINQESDNMSNLSIPEASPRAGRSRTTSSQTNLSHALTFDHSRGARTANLYGATAISMPAGNARPGLAHGETYVAGIPSSYILGGQHMLPPADADMRSQEEIMSEIDGDGSNDGDDAYSDDEPTPMPRAHQTGWLSDFDRTPRPQTNRSEYVHRPSTATETTSLLRRTSGQQSLNGEYLQGARTNWSRTGATSGWDILQPSPPGPEELIEIATESNSDNVRSRETRILIQYMIPTWLTHLLELSLNIVSVFSLGHLGVNELAASSLSSMTANVTGYSIIAGVVSALDSILPSAYTSQPKTVGLFTQRMTVIVAMMLPFIIVIWNLSEQLLLLLGQDRIIAALAGKYLRILSLSLPGYAGFEICRRYLQAQGLFHAPTLVLLFVSPLNALLNWLLVWGPDSIRLGFIGAPIASVIS